MNTRLTKTLNFLFLLTNHSLHQVTVSRLIYTLNVL